MALKILELRWLKELDRYIIDKSIANKGQILKLFAKGKQRGFHLRSFSYVQNETDSVLKISHRQVSDNQTKKQKSPPDNEHIKKSYG